MPPTLVPTVDPSPVLLGGTATATPNASDNSGITAQSCGAVDTTTVGTRSVTCSATDGAGNTATASVTYQVVYGFSGFAAPIDGGGVVNVAKAGQTIPLRWTLTDANGAPVTDLTTATVTAVTTNCGTGGINGDEVEQYTAGGLGLQNLGGGNYQFNWTTAKRDAGTCKTMHLDLGEGNTRTALFQFN